MQSPLQNNNVQNNQDNLSQIINSLLQGFQQLYNKLKAKFCQLFNKQASNINDLNTLYDCIMIGINQKFQFFQRTCQINLKQISELKAQKQQYEIKKSRSNKHRNQIIYGQDFVSEKTEIQLQYRYQIKNLNKKIAKLTQIQLYHKKQIQNLNNLLNKEKNLLQQLQKERQLLRKQSSYHKQQIQKIKKQNESNILQVNKLKKQMIQKDFSVKNKQKQMVKMQQNKQLILNKYQKLKLQHQDLLDKRQQDIIDFRDQITKKVTNDIEFLKQKQQMKYKKLQQTSQAKIKNLNDIINQMALYISNVIDYPIKQNQKVIEWYKDAKKHMKDSKKRINMIKQYKFKSIKLFSQSKSQIQHQL